MLTPLQIGQIAGHIKLAMHLHSAPPKGDNPVCMAAPDNFMEDWEKCLKDLIDINPILPSYEEVERDLCLDFLVTYYGS